MKKNLFFLLIVFALFSCAKNDVGLGTDPETTENSHGLYGLKHQNTLTKGVAPKSKLWDNGQTIKIKFLNGTEAQKNAVKTYAAEWLEHANLNFEYVETTADVKISFKWVNNGVPDNVTWSYLGTDSKIINQNYPSTNFGNLSPIPKLAKQQVLMQFGHILGLVNEHHNPESVIQWDTETVYAYYEYEGWTTEEIDNFFFRNYTASDAEYSEFDPQSIMVWPVEDFLTLDYNGMSGNYVLSEKDKDFIAELYPKKSLLEHIDLGSSIYNCAFANGSILFEANGLIYSFSLHYGIHSVDLSAKPVVRQLYLNSNTLIVSAFKIDNRIYFYDNGQQKYFDLADESVHNVNIDVQLINTIKGNDGVTYFGTGKGLYFLDTDNVLKPKDLYNEKGELMNSYGVHLLFKLANNQICAVAKKDSHTYFYNIDNTGAIELKLKLDWTWTGHETVLSPDGKIYLFGQSTGSGVLDENYVYHTILDPHTLLHPFFDQNGKPYCISMLRKNLYTIENKELVEFGYDPFLESNFFLNPATYRAFNGIYLIATQRDNGKVLLSNLYHIDITKPIPYAKKIPIGDNIRLLSSFETSTGDIYFTGGSPSTGETGLYKLNR